MTSETKYSKFGDTKLLQTIHEQVMNDFPSIFFEISKSWRTNMFFVFACGQDGGRTIMKIRVTCFENLEYGINIYQKQMKWKIGNMGPESIKKHVMAIW